MMMPYNAALEAGWSNLPFVSVSPSAGEGERDAEIEWWSVDSTGHYASDCEIGRAYATRFLEYVAETEDIPAFQRVISAVAQAVPTGIATGFFAEVASLAVVGRNVGTH